ncbi:MAG: hypothetical protein ACKOCN_04710 [Planctomycetaceae bacterium]
MPTTIQKICEFLDDFDLAYRPIDGDEAIALGFGIDEDESSYRDRDGDPHVQLIVRLVDEGEFVAIFAPMAWCLDGCEHVPAVMTAFIAIQSQFKMIRFDFDSADGEVRPNIELPIEDAELSSRQLHRAIAGLLQVLQRFDPVIRNAMKTGIVSFTDVEESRHTNVPRDVRRLRRLAERAGGIDALEQLLGGDAAVPDASASKNTDDADGPGREAG